MNTELLLSDAAHFRVEYEINPYMDTGLQPDRHAAIAEHEAIVRAHEAAGRRVRRIAAAWECPDMVYTANAAIVRGSRAVLGDPPPERKAEIPYFRDWLEDDGREVLDAPYPFSGQGDAGACSACGRSGGSTSSRCPLRRRPGSHSTSSVTARRSP